MLHDLPSISRICLCRDSASDISDDNDHLQVQQGTQPERFIIEDDCLGIDIPSSSRHFVSDLRLQLPAAKRFGGNVYASDSTSFETFLQQFESAVDRAYSTGVRKDVKFSINISALVRAGQSELRSSISEHSGGTQCRPAMSMAMTDYEIYSQIRKKERELDEAMIAMSSYVIYRNNTGETQTFTLDGKHIKSKKLKSLFIKFSSILFEYIRLRAILASRVPVTGVDVAGRHFVAPK